MGYEENEFLNAYDENRKEQNSELIDSNPLAFVIKKFVESAYNSSIYDFGKNDNDKITLFEGSPLRLLEIIGPIARVEGIDTTQKDWPKNRNWLVKRINLAKSTLKQTFGIEIVVYRDSSNSSILRIEKNISGISGKHKISPEIQNLSPYFDKLSPGDSNISPVLNPDLSTKLTKTGDTGDTGDNKAMIARESKKDTLDKNAKENIPIKQVYKTPVNSKLYENEIELQRMIKERGLYRKYPGSDKWACPNCNDSDDRFYMVNHICRMNKK